MFFRLAWLVVLLLASSSPGPTSAAAETAGRSETELFVHEMLRGVGAVQTDCPAEVVKPVRERNMQVVCATFDGGFDRFTARWNIQIIRTGSFTEHGAVRDRPSVEPQTDWEPQGESWDRIYRVGRSAVGVRFVTGDLLMVW